MVIFEKSKLYIVYNYLGNYLDNYLDLKLFNLTHKSLYYVKSNLAHFKTH